MSKPVDPIGQSDAVTRRAALRLGLTGLGVTALAMIGLPRSLFAFTLQEADVPTTTAYHSACGNVAYHQKLADEVRAILITRHMPADAVPQEVACPICGCKVALK